MPSTMFAVAASLGVDQTAEDEFPYLLHTFSSETRLCRSRLDRDAAIDTKCDAMTFFHNTAQQRLFNSRVRSRHQRASYAPGAGAAHNSDSGPYFLCIENVRNGENGGYEVEGRPTT
ncbi:hypothetical protein BC832DRAFT_56558 [Gaertneriomyces semiglobifer]|nr:hypothetical protein BC832DRAFT_56558 [Gaertneriomyces semiglobifer]